MTTLIVFTAPTDVQEQAYNEWYDNIHLAEVLALPGFNSARRFKLADAQLSEADSKPATHKYVAIYEVDHDSETAFKMLLDEVGSGRMELPECLDAAATQGLAYDCNTSATASVSIASQ